MAEGTGTTFFLDGAHTPESMATCAEWFFEASHTQQDSGLPADQTALTPHRILLFNCMKVITSCATRAPAVLHVQLTVLPPVCTCDSCLLQPPACAHAHALVLTLMLMLLLMLHICSLLCHTQALFLGRMYHLMSRTKPEASEACMWTFACTLP